MLDSNEMKAKKEELDFSSSSVYNQDKKGNQIQNLMPSVNFKL